jgi:23S rRNA (adenine1618-N6)-methyltransferase
MKDSDQNPPSSKSGLHPRNVHRDRYHFEALAKTEPELFPFVFENQYGDQTIDFANPDAVKSLNRALLKHFYKIEFWDIPDGFLCPPIPGRADYIHYAADLLAQSNAGKSPPGPKVKVLDIGTGANLIYPILGNSIYGWNFVGAELDQKSIASAQQIIDNNPNLTGKIELRAQTDSSHIFSGIIEKDEFFDITICNPPFHESAAEADAGSARKVNNLKGKTNTKPTLNFGGQANELWCEGGESKFIERMIRESHEFKFSCFWFTTLVAKEVNLPSIYSNLKRAGVTEMKTVPMSQGNKKSRIVAWTFLNLKQMENWRKMRWGG